MGKNKRWNSNGKIRENNMIKFTNKISIFIWAFIYTGQSIFLGLIIVLSIASPQNNLFPWQMAVGTVIGTILLLCSFYLWDRCWEQRSFSNKHPARNTPLYGALLILFGVSLYIVSCIGRNSPYSLDDYVQIWNGASELVEGRELTSVFYFQTYANNIKPMLFLSVLFRMADFLHCQDPFYFVLLWSIGQVLAAVWSVCFLAGNSKEERERYRIPILLLFVCTLPIWANVQAFYTDSMSFMMGIVTLALLKAGLETPRKGHAVLMSALAGVSVGMGLSVKVTVLIPLIAGLIVFCFCRIPIQKWRYLGIFILFSIGSWGLTDLWAGSFDIWNAAKETCNPTINWIALGLKGNGSWNDNWDYVTYTISLPSKAEKTEYALQYIRQNYREFWNISHLVQKLRFNFASGNFGAANYTYYAINEHNLLYESFSPWGKYYWRVSQLCFCYIFSIYTVYLLGAVAPLRLLLQKREVPAAKVVADLSLFGIALFLMVWEANNRQLYNQIPVIILGAVLNVRLLVSLRRPLFSGHKGSAKQPL